MICEKISSSIRTTVSEGKEKENGAEKLFEETEILFNITLDSLAWAIKLKREKIKETKRNSLKGNVRHKY